MTLLRLAHGAGNDFVVLDAREGRLFDREWLARLDGERDRRQLNLVAQRAVRLALICTGTSV